MLKKLSIIMSVLIALSAIYLLINKKYELLPYLLFFAGITHIVNAYKEYREGERWIISLVFGIAFLGFSMYMLFN